MTTTSRLRRAAARLLVPGLLLAGAARPAAAQDCAPGLLSTYLGSCDLSGWRFSDFVLISDASASGPAAAFAPALDGSTTFLTPFTGFDALGRRTFGFHLDGFRVGADAMADTPGGPTGAGGATGMAVLNFRATAIDPANVVSRTGFDLEISGATGTPGRTSLYQLALGGMADPNTGSACAFRFVENFGNGDKPRSVEQSCDLPRPDVLDVTLWVEADASRSDSPRAADGSSRAEFTRVSFTLPGQQVVPEPATVALLGGGLLALGAVARRRRG